MKARGSVPFNIAKRLVDCPAEENPSSIAVLDGGKRITYLELRQMTDRAARAILGLGCVRGERVGLILPNGVEFVAFFFSIAKIGAIAVPLDIRWSVEQTRDCFLWTEVRVAIVHVSVLDLVRRAIEKRPFTLVVVGEGAEALRSDEHRCKELLEAAGGAAMEASATEAATPAFLLHTSGSVARPKAAVHTHGNMLAAADNVGMQVLRFRPDDRVLSLPKLSFAFGLGCGMYFPLFAGATTILSGVQPQLDTVAQLIASHRPTIVAGVPSFWTVFLRAARTWLPVDLGSIRLLVSAGEALPETVFHGFKEAFGLEVLDGVGSTEMLTHFVSNRPGSCRAGSCGSVVPGCEIRLVDDQQVEVKDGKIGMLWVKGETSFVEYWKDPALTAACRVGEWIVTGDRFYRNEHGEYFYIGRADDMLKISGMWVSPAGVESVLCKYPGIERAFVTAVVDDSGIRRLVAYVVSTDPSQISRADLLKMVSEELPAYMLPAAIMVLAELPLTSNGKVRRGALPQPAWQTRVRR